VPITPESNISSLRGIARGFNRGRGAKGQTTSDGDYARAQSMGSFKVEDVRQRDGTKGEKVQNSSAERQRPQSGEKKFSIKNRRGARLLMTSELIGGREVLLGRTPPGRGFELRSHRNGEGNRSKKSQVKPEEASSYNWVSVATRGENEKKKITSVQKEPCAEPAIRIPEIGTRRILSFTGVAQIPPRRTRRPSDMGGKKKKGQSKSKTRKGEKPQGIGRGSGTTEARLKRTHLRDAAGGDLPFFTNSKRKTRKLLLKKKSGSDGRRTEKRRGVGEKKIQTKSSRSPSPGYRWTTRPFNQNGKKRRGHATIG